ncbi:hypothetical protein PybrP1_011290, partial [[Pythium] brassicae (nom. inval.)]
RKGLRNDAGANNCFLNVVIQSLWHVRSCRALISAGDHAVHHRCGGDVTRASARGLTSSSSSSSVASVASASVSAAPCLLCELEQIFILYEFSEAPVLDVDRVRAALGDVFAVGDMNDATEALEAILDALHWDTLRRMLALRRQQQQQQLLAAAATAPVGGQLRHAGELSQSMKDDASAIVCEPICIAHLVFQMSLMELQTCAQCGATAEPLLSTDFLYRVYAQELLQHARSGSSGAGAGAGAGGRTLEEVLRLEAQGGDSSDASSDTNDSDQAAFRPACERCRVPMRPSRWLLTLPMVFAVSVVWASDRVNKAEVRAWMALLSSQSRPPPATHPSSSRASSSSTTAAVAHNPQTLHLDRVFHVDQASAAAADYAFRGMVCYYGRHYVGFFASRSAVDGATRQGQEQPRQEQGQSPERWYLFDDTRVQLVGAWADVRLRVERGGYQPTLLFYERNGLEPTKLEKVASEIHAWWKETADGVAGVGERAGETPGDHVGGAHHQHQHQQHDDAHMSASSASSVVATGMTGVAGVAVIDDDDDGSGETLVAVEDNADLLAAMKESLRVQAPRSTQLPVSPINASSVGTGVGATGPRPLPARMVNAAGNATGSAAWHDDALFLMHKSAEDTLSRVNGLLSKGRAPLSTTAVANGEMTAGDLRRTMSMSMRRSVRKREYSFRSATQHVLDVNRDEIFRDLRGVDGNGADDASSSGLSSPLAAAAMGSAMPPLSPIRQGIPETMYGFVQRASEKSTSSAHTGQSSVQQQHQQALQPSQPSHQGRVRDDMQQAARGAPEEIATKPFRIFDVELNASDGGVGLVLEAASASWCALKSCERAFVVSGFEPNGAGKKLAAEASGAICVGDVLLAINGHVLASEALYSVLELLWTSPNPVRLAFQRLQSWACDKCTLENPAGGFSCGACGHTVQLKELTGEEATR